MPMSGLTEDLLEQWQLDEKLFEEEVSPFLMYGKNFSYYDLDLFDELSYKGFDESTWG